ncbi:hypothetical protein WN55_07033 [Dufourea novaeangliae]|uniref:Uncharacterized protein n=1 Tax=Dufourea novaeangliae TaxID=178035 RepID=A0A154PR95_DUFNO|nr:hypothetical protein WN55_07033 [Dufourea novaeangliae]
MTDTESETVSSSSYNPESKDVSSDDETEAEGNELEDTSTERSRRRSLNLTAIQADTECDDSEMTIPDSRDRRKNNFCLFCQKFQTTIVRHLETVHANEIEVQKFAFLPKRNPERRKIIDKLRKDGNFQYNTNATLNKEELIVCRRPSAQRGKTAADFLACAQCHGFFSKNHKRHHIRECMSNKHIKNTRTAGILSRTITCRIHPCATLTLKRVVFPVMRDDLITRLIRYDELVMTYASKMCAKYRQHYQHDMIRHRMRLLGRFFLAIKRIDKNIESLETVYDPKLYDNCISAIQVLAEFDIDTNTFKKPSTGSTLGTLLKQTGQVLRSLCIKRGDHNKQVKVENFLKLYEEDFGPKLHFFRYNYLIEGEIEHILMEDINNMESVTKETQTELYKALNATERRAATKYVRFTIRGKLGVPEKNPFLFGIPCVDKTRHKWLRACVLMRKYSSLSGAKLPNTLRGTMLRKHIATKCISLNLSDNQVIDLANFMGHHDKIHRSHYRQSILTKNLGISCLLEHAQGDDASSDEESTPEPEVENQDAEYENDNAGACEEITNFSLASNSISYNENERTKHVEQDLDDDDDENIGTDKRRGVTTVRPAAANFGEVGGLGSVKSTHTTSTWCPLGPLAASAVKGANGVSGALGNPGAGAGMVVKQATPASLSDDCGARLVDHQASGA